MINSAIYLEGVHVYVSKHNEHKIHREAFIGPTEQATMVQEKIKLQGISREFAKLRTDEDIIGFADTYGLLGLHTGANMFIAPYDQRCYLSNFAYSRHSRYETLSEWRLHISHVRKLLKLYSALTRNRPIEDDIIRLQNMPLWATAENVPLIRFAEEMKKTYWQERIASENDNIHFERATVLGSRLTDLLARLKPGNAQEPTDCETPTQLFYCWNDGTPTLLPYIEALSSVNNDYRAVAKMILRSHLDAGMKNTIVVSFGAKNKQAVPSEVQFADRKSTHYLISAIYYDLWRILTVSEPTGMCSVCGNPFFLKRTDAEYCGNACKTRSYRKRINNGGKVQ